MALPLALCVAEPVSANERPMPGRQKVAQRSSAPRRVAILPANGGSGLTARVGTPLKLSATLELESGARVPIDEYVAWSSSDPAVLRVSDGRDGNAPGTAIPLRPGLVGIAITYPRFTGPPPPHPPDRPLGDAITIYVRGAS